MAGLNYLRSDVVLGVESRTTILLKPGWERVRSLSDRPYLRAIPNRPFNLYAAGLIHGLERYKDFYNLHWVPC